MERKRAVDLLRAVYTNDGSAVPLLSAIPPAAWHHIIRQLQQLELAPLFFSHLSRIPAAAACVPSGVLDRLRETYFLHAARNTIILADLRAVIRSLALHGIDSIVLKGACLVETVYDDIALRPMHDIDILIREKDMCVVQAILVDAGYGPRIRPPVEDQLLRHHHLLPFTRPGRPSVEVHASLTTPDGPCAMPMEGFWDRAATASFGGLTALTLSPEDLLLHLCLHFSANHRFSIFEMKNLCDIGETIKRYRAVIDWHALGERAGGYGVAKYVYCTLRVSAALFGAQLRAEDLQHMGHDDDTQMADLLAHLLLEETAIPLPDALEKLEREHGLVPKAWVLARSIVPSRRHLARKYALSPATATDLRTLYLRHWMEGLMRAGELLAHLICGSTRARATISRRRATARINNWLRCGSSRVP